jgi:phenylacetate-CoA ligase
MTDPILAVQREAWAPRRERDAAAAATVAGDAAATLPFYAERFAGHDLTEPGSFTSLPTLSKKELRREQELHPPYGRLVPEPTEVAQLHMTSGTSGRPVYVPVALSDLRLWAPSFGRMLHAGGLVKGDLILQVFAMSRAFGGGLPHIQHSQLNGMGILPLGAEAGARRILTSAQNLQPVAAYGTPHFLLYLGEQAEEIIGGRLSERLKMKAMFAGGEPGTAALRDRLEELWGGHLFEMYGSSEAIPGCWHDCDSHDGMHFSGQGITHCEILSATGESLPFEPGVMGEIVYSDLPGRIGMRLIRYRSGDLVEVTAMDCQCGRTGPRIRVQGRVDDMLLVRGLKVFPADLQEAVTDFVPEVSGRVQLRWHDPGYSTQSVLDLHVERGEGAISDDAALAERVAEAVRSRVGCRAEITLVPFEALKPADDVKAELVVSVAVEKS